MTEYKESVMHHVPIIFTGMAAQAIYRSFRSKRRVPKAVNICPEWDGELIVPRPVIEVRHDLDAYLRRNGYNPLSRYRMSTMYERGAPDVTSVPFSRKLGWHDVPVHLVVVYHMYASFCHVDFCYRGGPATEFHPSVRSYFQNKAKMELNAASRFLNNLAQSEEGPQGPAQYGQQKRPSEDLDLLGLSVGFTSDELQAAYRAACRKYHPDRLVGVPEDVVKLAQEHFVKVQTAYERLRSHQQQPC